MALSKINFSPIQQDLALVAFESARADNRAAFSLPNSFVDQFEDSSGIDATSSTVRSTGEYVSSTVENDQEIQPRADLSWTGNINTQVEYWSQGPTINGSQRKYETTAVGSGYSYSTTTIDLTNVTKLEFEFEVVTKGGGGGPFWAVGFNKNGGTSGASYTGTTTSAVGNYAKFDSGSSVGNRVKTIYYVATGQIHSYRDEQGDGTFEQVDEAGGTMASYTGSAWSSTTATSMGLFMPGWTDGGSNWHIGVRNGIKTVLTTNATGNFTSATQSASASVDKMSIVVMYEDNAGTAALNTDLVAQVSANNGTDFTTVTLSAAPNLNSTTKVAKSAEISVTAGTQPKYKISFANQSASKITRVLGVALLY